MGKSTFVRFLSNVRSSAFLQKCIRPCLFNVYLSVFVRTYVCPRMIDRTFVRVAPYICPSLIKHTRLSVFYQTKSVSQSKFVRDLCQIGFRTEHSRIRITEATGRHGVRSDTMPSERCSLQPSAYTALLRHTPCQQNRIEFRVNITNVFCSGIKPHFCHNEFSEPSCPEIISPQSYLVWQ
jgi:hypothetical protein